MVLRQEYTLPSELDFVSGPLRVEVFSSSGNWSKPAGARMVYVVCVGGGGGGGSGRWGGTPNISVGAGGGGGGEYRSQIFIASDIAESVTITIGAGGSGAASNTSHDSDGSDGSVGGNSSFGSHLVSNGGGKGIGGPSSSTSPGGPGGTRMALTVSGVDAVSGEGAGDGSGEGNNSEEGGAAGGRGRGASGNNDGRKAGSSIFGGGGGGGGGGAHSTATGGPGGAGGNINAYTSGGGGSAGTAQEVTVGLELIQIPHKVLRVEVEAVAVREMLHPSQVMVVMAGLLEEAVVEVEEVSLPREGVEMVEKAALVVLER